MYWGKLGAIAATTLLLAGCSGGTTATQTPSPTSTLVANSQTGDPAADKLIEIIKRSCALGQSKGMAIYVPNRKETIYSFPVEAGASQLDDLNYMTLSGGKYEIAGWPGGDPLCVASMYVERLVPIGSPENADGVVFDYELKKIDESTYDLGLYQQSSIRSFTRYHFEDNLITSMKWDNGYSFSITYGPLDQKINAARQKALVEEGMQYLPIGQKVWGMTLAEAKVYLKKQGLTLLVGGKDGEYFFPSGPPGGKSDPKRMIVNIMEGKIVGVWTM
jgi:hypothetical protein